MVMGRKGGPRTHQSTVYHIKLSSGQLLMPVQKGNIQMSGCDDGVKLQFLTIVSKKPSKFCRCNVCQRTTCRLNQDASVKLPLEKMPL